MVSTELPFAGDAITVSIHFCTRTMGKKVLSLGTGSHLGAIDPAVTGEMILFPRGFARQVRKYGLWRRHYDGRFRNGVKRRSMRQRPEHRQYSYNNEYPPQIVLPT
jgi:hypothetical protein